MRTIPPGEDREEGEGKKPIVVGEPGGLETERKKAQTQTVSVERKKNQNNHISCCKQSLHDSQVRQQLWVLAENVFNEQKDTQRSLMFITFSLTPLGSVINYPCPNLSPWEDELY